MKPATYDELLEDGLICPDTPHDIVYRYMTTLHRDPLPEELITSDLENNNVENINNPNEPTTNKTLT